MPCRWCARASRTRGETPSPVTQQESLANGHERYPRPANVRTQELADKTYGTTGQRFRVAMDSTTEDGKPGPSIGEHFPLDICAHSDLEASGRYQQIMGIRKTDYPIRAVPVAA